MTTEEIVAAAYGHFITFCPMPMQYISVFARYGAEELELSTEKIPEFILTARYGDGDEIDCREDDRFYTWYYCNYMVNENKPTTFTTRIHAQEILAFIGTQIRPVQLLNREEEVFIENCDPDLSDFWSVYLLYAEGPAICIADCRDQQTAQDLETLVHTIGNNSQ